jgi:hypothetical protein
MHPRQSAAEIRLPGSTDEASVAGIVVLVGGHIRIGRLERLAELRSELILLTLLPYVSFSETQCWANLAAGSRATRSQALGACMFLFEIGWRRHLLVLRPGELEPGLDRPALPWGRLRSINANVQGPEVLPALRAVCVPGAAGA